jgi:GH43 family beta-xylosidase
METYVNPVYTRNFPDPFVLKYRGEYWAYCTGVWKDGRCFGVLRSRDLVHWQEVGGAMEPLAEYHPHYWAPEVTYHNGTFYLYYSAGDELNSMHIRVATASHPDGPFVDSGRQLTPEAFAIDPHVFVAGDGTWHLFYATDFVDHTHVGTGTARDRMLDPYTLAGNTTAVTRPRYDWHMFDPQRAEKGGARWHTIEGSFVLERKGRFYQMFSGGNWQNLSYGVAYALADQVDQTEEWQQSADGEHVLPILRTVPGKVIGPGHNSVVCGPDNMQLYCIYHRWAADSSGRVLAIDPLDWAGERMLVLGPSTASRPAPNQPTIADFFEHDHTGRLGERWKCTGGRWRSADSEAFQETSTGAATARRPMPASGVVEVSLRALDPSTTGRYGLAFGNQLFVLLAPAQHQLIITTISRDTGPAHARIPLPAGFDPGAFHLLRVEINAGRAVVALDGNARRWTTRLPNDEEIDTVALATERATAAFSGFAITAGWQDLFAERGVNPADLGWRTEGAGAWRVDDGRLLGVALPGGASAAKGPPLEQYELVINARLDDDAQADGSYGFHPAYREQAPGPLFVVERRDDGWALTCRDGDASEVFRMPSFDPSMFQQFRFRKYDGRLSVHWEGHALGQIAGPAEATRVGLYVARGAASFEMVRVTALNL